MRKPVLPLLVFALGLFVADDFFGIDVQALFEGVRSDLVTILNGGNK